VLYLPFYLLAEAGSPSYLCWGCREVEFLNKAWTRKNMFSHKGISHLFLVAWIFWRTVVICMQRGTGKLIPFCLDILFSKMLHGHMKRIKIYKWFNRINDTTLKFMCRWNCEHLSIVHSSSTLLVVMCELAMWIVNGSNLVWFSFVCRRCTSCCQNIVNVDLVIYGIDVVDSNFDGGVRLDVIDL